MYALVASVGHSFWMSLPNLLSEKTKKKFAIAPMGTFSVLKLIPQDLPTEVKKIVRITHKCYMLMHVLVLRTLLNFYKAQKIKIFD